MKHKEYRNIIKADRNRYGNASHMMLYIKNAGYRIIVNYRRCKLYEGNKAAFILYMLQRLKYNRLCVRYGCDIPSHASIGAGFKIDHPVGIIINSGSKIGENVTVKSGAVIGKNDKGVPIVGNNVLIGVHALIIGNIKIGDGAQIGAGAIVTHDVSKNSVVVCNPAHER